MTDDLFDFADNSPILQAFKTAFEKMKASTYELQDRLRDDAASLPYQIVTHSDPSGPDAHAEALDSISYFHFPELGEERPFHTGVLCVTPETAAFAQVVNTDRMALKDVVSLMREEIADKKSDINRVMKRVFQRDFAGKGSNRDEAFNSYLKQLGLVRIDLTHCYAFVRILPEGTLSVSWTWNRKHTAMKKFTQEDVLQLARKEVDDETKAKIMGLIAKVPSDHILVQKKSLPPALRANLVGLDEKNPSKYKRTPVTVSGIMLSIGDGLPELLWREKPEEGADEKPTRLSRRVPPDVQLPTEPHIKKYNLFMRKARDEEPSFR